MKILKFNLISKNIYFNNIKYLNGNSEVTLIDDMGIVD